MNRVEQADSGRPSEIPQEIESLLKSVEQASRALLMLDYDGTLAPFRKQRNQAFPYPGVASVLQKIVRGGHTRVVIVSGRDTGETLGLLGIDPCPELWGLHGLQRREPDGTQHNVPVEGRVLDALLDAERWLSYQQLQHTAEFKTGSIAVHWRGLNKLEAEEIRSRALLGWRPIAKRSTLELLDFDCGLEIRMPKPNKGDVVRVLLEEMGSGTPAAYLGDDSTDERAFLSIRGSGLGILVHPTGRTTAAEAWLKSSAELQDFLERWLDATERWDAAGESAAAGGC